MNVHDMSPSGSDPEGVNPLKFTHIGGGWATANMVARISSVVDCDHTVIDASDVKLRAMKLAAGRVGILLKTHRAHATELAYVIGPGDIVVTGLDSAADTADALESIPGSNDVIASLLVAFDSGLVDLRYVVPGGAPRAPAIAMFRALAEATVRAPAARVWGPTSPIGHQLIIGEIRNTVARLLLADSLKLAASIAPETAHCALIDGLDVQPLFVLASPVGFLAPARVLDAALAVAPCPVARGQTVAVLELGPSGAFKLHQNLQVGRPVAVARVPRIQVDWQQVAELNEAERTMRHGWRSFTSAASRQFAARTSD